MSQFEITINGTTLNLTTEDMAAIETAMADAMRTPHQKTFRKGTKGNVYAKLVNAPGSDGQHFNQGMPAGYIETDC